MRSTGLGMLPIGSVGMIDAVAAMLSLPLAQISSPATDWTDASRISHRLGKPHPLLRERAWPPDASTLEPAAVLVVQIGAEIVASTWAHGTPASRRCPLGLRRCLNVSLRSEPRKSHETAFGPGASVTQVAVVRGRWVSRTGRWRHRHYKGELGRASWRE